MRQQGEWEKSEKTRYGQISVWGGDGKIFHSVGCNTWIQVASEILKVAFRNKDGSLGKECAMDKVILNSSKAFDKIVPNFTVGRKHIGIMKTVGGCTVQ